MVIDHWSKGQKDPMGKRGNWENTERGKIGRKLNISALLDKTCARLCKILNYFVLKNH
jgi:hypothetical protein